ncbi:acyltransferase [soil metagenome]
MNQKRNTTVDFLRGFAMLLIILIHVTVYFRSNPLANVLWEYSQVAVPIFVFCSGYLYFSRSKEEPLTLAYFWKRIKRLVIPYYFYLIIFSLYTVFLRGRMVPFNTLIKNIFFLNISSRDLDWLVVLFLYFMVLMPLIRAFSKRPVIFWIYTIISFTSAFILLFINTQHAFRLIMWLPWSLVLIVTYLLVQYENTRWFFRSIIFIFSGIFLVSKSILLYTRDTLTLTENKYPPNIFYLSYGISLLLILYIFHRKYGSFMPWLQKCFDFLSKYSYSIFFIHFLILAAFLDFGIYKRMEWWQLFAVVLILTLIVQWSINTLHYFRSTLKNEKPL